MSLIIEKSKSGFIKLCRMKRSQKKSPNQVKATVLRKGKEKGKGVGAFLFTVSVSAEWTN